jgi:hypothetical protein
VPLCAVPLLCALRTAASPSGYTPLAKRLAAVLTQQLASCRPALPSDLSIPSSDAQEVSTVSDLLKKVMYFAARDHHAETRAAAIKAYTMLLRAVADAAAQGNASAEQLLEEQSRVCVQDTLGCRKTRWTHTTLAGIARAVPRSACTMLVQGLASTGAGARTEFVRIEALHTCAASLRCAQLWTEFVCSRDRHHVYAACLRCSRSGANFVQIKVLLTYAVCLVFSCS